MANAAAAVDESKTTNFRGGRVLIDSVAPARVGTATISGTAGTANHQPEMDKKPYKAILNAMLDFVKLHQEWTKGQLRQDAVDKYLAMLCAEATRELRAEVTELRMVTGR